MSRFILRFRGAGAVPVEDIERIRASHDVNVIESAGRMLLVDAPADVLRSLAQSMADWTISEERTVSIPDPRPKLREEK